MTSTTTPRLSACVGALVVAAVLSGCAPTPSATPTPTPLFDSEEEAFAAAEQTYRAYNDASNARRSGDTSAHPEEYLIGSALEADLAASDYLRSQGLMVTGVVEIVEFHGTQAKVDDESASLKARVCLDSSGTHLVSVGGVDLTPSDREVSFALKVRMVTSGGEFKIEDESAMEPGRC